MGFRSASGAAQSLGAICVLSSTLSAVSCDLAQNLTDVGGSLTNPDAALLDRPGRKLASGAYRHLLVDGSLENGGHVVAIRSDREQEEIAIIPYLEGSGCFVTPGIAVERISSRVDVELSGMLAIQRDQNESGRGEITFVDFDCDELNSLQDASIPQIAFPIGQPRGILTITTSGDLYFVNPRSQAIDRISEGVSTARTAGNSLWTIESGELVARDINLQEIGRMGTGVVEFVVAGGSKITAAYRDEDGISIWTADESSTVISKTGCGILAWGGDTIGFTEPCQGGELHVYTIGSRIGSDEEFVTLVGPKDVIYPERAITTWGQGTQPSEIVLTVSDPDQVGDRLMVASIPEEATEEDGVYRLEFKLLSDDSATIRGGQIFIDWDGVTGKLVELWRDDDDLAIGLLEIAPGVAQLLGDGPYSPLGVLTDFENGVGSLRAYSKKGTEIESTLLAKKVPVQTQYAEEDTGRRLFIADSRDGSVGALYLTDGPSGKSPAKSRKIADNVYVDTARFLDQPRGVAYLAGQADSDYVALRVWLMDSELTLTIHETVSEYRMVPWPAPGILYAVPAGDDQGLWFSKAR